MAEPSLAMEAVEVLNQIGIFDVLVPFMIVSAALYGVLEKSKLFGDRHDVNAMVAIAAGILSIVSLTLNRFILNFMPVVLIFAVFLLIVLLLITWMGLKPETIVKFLKEPAVWMMLMIIILSLVTISLNQTRTEISGNVSIGTPTEEVTPETLTDPMAVVTQPKVVGVIFVLVLFAVITYMMTAEK